MLIYILRHGTTEWNSLHKIQGRTDILLDDLGREMARQTGERLKERGIRFDKVYSSPLKRAVRTAELITPGCRIVTDERLIEMDYGPYEGASLTEPPAEIITFFSDFKNNPAPEGMESLASVVERAGAFLEDIRDLSGNILISTHAIAMKGLLEYLTPGSNGAYWSKNIGNCAVYKAEHQNGKIGIPEEI